MYRLIIQLPFTLHNKFASLTCNFSAFVHHFFQRGRFSLFPMTRSPCVGPFFPPVIAKVTRRASKLARDRIPYRSLRALAQVCPHLHPRLQFYWSLRPCHDNASQ